MPTINATLCYIKRPSQTLMLHRVKKLNDIHKDKWNGLGGKFEPGESPEECVIREVREECGLTIRRPQLKGVLTFPKFDGLNDWLVFVFVAWEFEGELHDPEDTMEGHLEWVDDEKLLALPLWEGDLIFLPWLEQPGIFSAKFVYETGRLVAHDVAFYE